MANPLDPVDEWYHTTLDCLRVAERVAEQSIASAITDKHTTLYHLPSGEQVERIQQAKTELARLAILDLVAVFERTVRTYLGGAVAGTLPAAHPFGDALQHRVGNDIEFWKFKEQLIDAFGAVDGSIRGEVKQIVDYRNWAAHGWHVQRPAPMGITPDDAYQRLSAFLTAAGVVA